MNSHLRPRNWFPKALLAVMACARLALTTLGTGQKPNILCIASDDQGWKDIGFHGSDIRTPTPDKLVQSGARLEHFYAQPMRTPTRGALMTGRYPEKGDSTTLLGNAAVKLIEAQEP